MVSKGATGTVRLYFSSAHQQKWQVDVSWEIRLTDRYSPLINH